VNAALGINDYDVVIDERGTETSELVGRGVQHVKNPSYRRLPASPWHFRRSPKSLSDLAIAPASHKADTVSGSTTATSSADNEKKKSFKSSVQVMIGSHRSERYEFIPVKTKTTTPSPIPVESILTTLQTLKRNGVSSSKYYKVGPVVGGEDEVQAAGSGEIELASTTSNIMTSQWRITTATMKPTTMTSLTTLITTRSTCVERDVYPSVTSMTSSIWKKLNDTAPLFSPRLAEMHSQART